jgi:hypothetical protein
LGGEKQCKMLNMLEFLRRRRKHSYNELWEILYGGRHDGDKGLLREYGFMNEVAVMWACEAKRLRRVVDGEKQ